MRFEQVTADLKDVRKILASTQAEITIMTEKYTADLQNVVIALRSVLHEASCEEAIAVNDGADLLTQLVSTIDSLRVPSNTLIYMLTIALTLSHH